MTSNLGSEHFRKLTSPLGFLPRTVGVEQVQGEVMRELERRFPPEFRNRIDEVVLFAPLDARRGARDREALPGAGRRSRWPRPARRLQIDDEALELVVTKGYSMAFGARFLKRFIDEQIKLPISARWKEGSHFDGQGDRRRDRRRSRAGREIADAERHARIRRRRISMASRIASAVQSSITTRTRPVRVRLRQPSASCVAALASRSSRLLKP